MAGEAYWGYWKHKVEQLWKEMEELKARVTELEGKGPAPAPAGKGLVPVKVREDSRITPPAPVIEGSGYKDPVLKILKAQGPMNVVDINSALKGEGTNESVRDTLFNRVKPLLKKGAVKYDEGTQTFSVG